MTNLPHAKPQHMRALDLANEVRIERAERKRQIAAMPRPEGMAAAAAIFDDPDEVTGSLKLLELLSSIDHFGLMKTREIAQHAGVVSVDRRVRDLTPRQRTLIAAVLSRPAILWPSTAKRSAA